MSGRHWPLAKTARPRGFLGQPECTQGNNGVPAELPGLRNGSSKAFCAGFKTTFKNTPALPVLTAHSHLCSTRAAKRNGHPLRPGGSCSEVQTVRKPQRPDGNSNCPGQTCSWEKRGNQGEVRLNYKPSAVSFPASQNLLRKHLASVCLRVI